MSKELTIGNLNFTFHQPYATEMEHRPAQLNIWIMNVTRASDGHRLPDQRWFDTHSTRDELTDNECNTAAHEWIAEHPDAHIEPEKKHCFACGTELLSDHDTKYQFDNALWIGLHGGYGMFVDNLDASMPVNTSDRWLYRDEEVVDNPDWRPEYREERVLPGAPDYEAVICHECVHVACEALPWLERLIDSHKSHSHGRDYHDDHPEHYGWDYDRHA